MEELKKYKKRILFNLIALFALGLISVTLLIGSAPVFKGDGYVLALIVIFLINVPLFLSTGLIGIKVINGYIINEQKKSSILSSDMDELDKEVEEKIKEADDLTFNLNRLSDDLEPFEDWKGYGHSLLTAISKQIEIVIGLVYVKNDEDYNVIAEYAYYSDSLPVNFKSGEGLSGQVVKDKKAIFLTEIPEGYMHVISGLGKNEPKFLSIFPIIKNQEVVGIIELATFADVGVGIKRRADGISESIGKLAPELIMTK